MHDIVYIYVRNTSRYCNCAASDAIPVSLGISKFYHTSIYHSFIHRLHFRQYSQQSKLLLAEIVHRGKHKVIVFSLVLVSL